MAKMRRVGVLLVLGGSIAAAISIAAQQAPAPQAAWAGWARCQVTVTGPGYTDQQTHTWTITGSTPTVEGAFRVYPGTWSVAGGGSVQRTQGTQTLMAQWATNAMSTSAPIAVFVRASDGRTFIQARHAQLRGAAGVQGFQQQTVDGRPQTPVRIAAEAFEWTFPTIDVSPSSPTASGSSAPVVNGSVGLMQPAGSRVAASCTWQFSGSAVPAPPPPITAQTIPTPPVIGGPQSPAATVASTPATLAAPTAPVQPATPAAPVAVAPDPPATPPAVPPSDFSVVITPILPNNLAAWAPNGTATYRVDVTNAGPGAGPSAVVNNVVLTLPAVPGLTLTSVSCSAGFNGCPANPTVAQIESGLPIPSLFSYTRVTFTITGRVTAATGNSINMTSALTLPAGVNDPDAANNRTTSTVGVATAPTDFSVAVTPVTPTGTTTWAPGGTATYRVDVTNAGPGAGPSAVVNNVVITVPPVPGLTLTSVSCSAGFNGCPANPTTVQIESGLAIPALFSYSRVTFTIAGRVTAATGNSISMTSALTLPAGVNDPDTANNRTTSTVPVVTAPTDFSVTVTPLPPGVTSWTPNGIATYQIDVTNAGPGAGPSAVVNGVVITVPSSAGLTKTAVTCSAGFNGCPTNPTVAQIESGLAIPSLFSYTRVTFTITGRVTGAAGGAVVLAPTLRLPAGVNDPAPANNASTHTLPVR